MRQTWLIVAALGVAVGCTKTDNPIDDAAVVDAPGSDGPATGDPDATVPPGDGSPGTDATVPPIDARLPACAPVRGTKVAVKKVGEVDEMPVLVTAPKGDDRLFVVKKSGQIDILKDGNVTEFLDVPDVYDGSSEQGLLGLVFHPNYAQNRTFYVYYTATRSGDPDFPYSNVVTEFKTKASNPDQADRATKRTLLTIRDPKWNHNGGMMEFGRDGNLWIGTGDGGDGGDRSQKPADMLGKILRIDVSGTSGSKQYKIPSGNPFASSADGPGDPRPEVWAVGLRNPWRWSFDSKTGDLFIGDVGQSTWEEINIVLDSAAGANFGWNPFEGNDGGGDRAGKTFPVVVKPNTPWQAIIGGQVYRGACFPDLDGTYFYSDHSQKELWSFKWVNNAVQGNKKLLDLGFGPTSIHADGQGELYVTADNGEIFRLVATP